MAEFERVTNRGYRMPFKEPPGEETIEEKIKRLGTPWEGAEEQWRQRIKETTGRDIPPTTPKTDISTPLEAPRASYIGRVPPFPETPPSTPAISSKVSYAPPTPGAAPKAPTATTAPTAPTAPTTPIFDTTITPPTSVTKEEELPSFDISPPEELDYKAEIAKILSGVPGTAEELVGRPPVNVREEHAKQDIFARALQGGLAGARGLTMEQVLDKEQARLDDIYKKDLEQARSKLGTKLQLQEKQLEIALQRDKEKREGYAKMWAGLGEANPERFKNDPGWWKMGMRAYRMSEDSIRKFVASCYNPQTGKYEGLYIPPWKREFEATKSLMNELPKLIPGLPKEAYAEMVLTHKWPDYLDKGKKELEFRYINETDPVKKEQLRAKISEIERIKDYVGVSDFEHLEAFRPFMSPKAYQFAREHLIMTKVRGTKMAELFAKYIEAEQIKEASRTTVRPSEGEIKQANLAGVFRDPTAIVMLQIDPSYRLMAGDKDKSAQFTNEYKVYSSLLESLQTDPNYKLKAEEKKLVLKYRYNQLALLSNLGYRVVAEALSQKDVDIKAAIIAAQDIISLVTDPKTAPRPEVVLEALKQRGIIK